MHTLFLLFTNLTLFTNLCNLRTQTFKMFTHQSRAICSTSEFLCTFSVQAIAGSSTMSKAGGSRDEEKEIKYVPGVVLPSLDVYKVRLDTLLEATATEVLRKLDRMVTELRLYREANNAKEDVEDRFEYASEIIRASKVWDPHLLRG